MSPPESMSCAEAEPLLPLVADGAVGPDSDPQLFAHLASCPACQRAVAEHDLVTLALERGARRIRKPAARIVTFPRLAAAAALLAALGTLVWLQQRETPRPPAIAHADPPIRAPAPVAPAVPPMCVASAPAPAVVRVPRGDGSSVYLVRRGGEWMAFDPAQLDGPDQAAVPNADGIRVNQPRRLSPSE